MLHRNLKEYKNRLSISVGKFKEFYLFSKYQCSKLNFIHDN